MLLTQLHRLSWFPIALRMVVVVSLLVPRLAWGECRCESSCVACDSEREVADDTSKADGQDKPAEVKPKGCCCDPAKSCCCCSPGDESPSTSTDTSEPKSNKTSDQPTRGEPSNDQPDKRNHQAKNPV